MTKNTWLALIFFTFTLVITFRKQLAWLYWKWLRLKNKEQTSNLLVKHRFIEITGASGVGKSWFLSHLFKNLQGVKFTNIPTPNHTLSKEILETHFIAKWAAPNKWYYLLDDINIWQKWCQQELGIKGYEVLKDYLTQVGKLGGTFVWTNNGIEPEHILKVQKNKTLTVQWHYQFLNRYSLLAVRTQENWYNFLPTIIAIDNEEMKEFYDPHWNVPKQMQENWLEYIFDQKLHAEEGKAILAAIKESGLAISDEEWVKKIKFDRNLILKYLETQNKKEKIVRGKKEQFQKFKEDVNRYEMKGKEPTFADIDKWDKEDKNKKRTKTDNLIKQSKTDGKSKTKQKFQGNLIKDQNITKELLTEENNLPIEDLDLIQQDPDPLSQNLTEESNDSGESNSRN